MCDCKSEVKGNGKNIALSFSGNKIPVAAIFNKYGMGKLAPTPENALAGTVLYGGTFAKEVAMAAAGMNPNVANYEGQEGADLAATIFQILGTAANAGINIAQGVADIKNGNKPNTNPTNTGQPVVVYAPTPTPTTPQTQGWLTNTQLGLILLAVVLVAGALLYMNYTEKK